MPSHPCCFFNSLPRQIEKMLKCIFRAWQMSSNPQQTSLEDFSLGHSQKRGHRHESGLLLFIDYFSNKHASGRLVPQSTAQQSNLPLKLLPITLTSKLFLSFKCIISLFSHKLLRSCYHLAKVFQINDRPPRPKRQSFMQGFPLYPLRMRSRASKAEQGWDVARTYPNEPNLLPFTFYQVKIPPSYSTKPMVAISIRKQGDVYLLFMRGGASMDRFRLG